MVEDDAIVRRVVGKLLMKLGYHVIEAKNGSEGVELARQKDTNIDLVVTDVVMPESAGKDMMLEIKKIRRTSRRFTCPAIPTRSSRREASLIPGSSSSFKKRKSPLADDRTLEGRLLDRAKFPLSAAAPMPDRANTSVAPLLFFIRRFPAVLHFALFLT